MMLFTSHDTGISEVEKEIDGHCMAVKRLFFGNPGTGGAESLLPTERVADAEEKIERAYRLFQKQQLYPNLKDSFARLEKACEDATKRMERFKQFFGL